METLVQDIRYAARGLRKAPAFTIVALLTLALGIGVNSAIFSVVNAILFRPLPVESPDQLVDIYGREATSSAHETSSYPNYVEYRAATRTLSNLIAYSNFFAHLSIEGSSEIVVGELVSDNYFATLGVRPALGRVFTAPEAAGIGSSPFAVISDRLWKNRFHGASDVVGKTFRMNGTIYTIVGVARPEFRGMIPAVTAQMWIPITMAEKVSTFGDQRTHGPMLGANRFERRGQSWLWMKGRMKPGMQPAQVSAEFDALLARLGEQYPETMAKERISVVPTRDVRVNPDFDKTVAPAGLLLVAAVGLVLIVACANLANLMLARAAGRRRELAVRAALGAARIRLVRQLFTESVLLALLGGALAVPLAAGLSGLIARVQPPLPIDLGLAVSPDWRVLTFTMIAAIATGVVFGLVPAVRASRPDLVPALKDSSASGRRARIELRDALVVVQVAVSLVLVVAAALLVRSLSAAGRVNLGYDPDHTAYLSLDLDMTGYDASRGGRFLEDGVERLRTLPQVEAVALTSRLPLSLNNNGFSVFIEGRQLPANGRALEIDGAYVDERYFGALQLRLLAGRGIEAADRDEHRHVVVISHAMAQRYWPGRPDNAIGRGLRLREGGDLYQVVGVVSDYKVDTPGETPKAYIHLPLARNDTYGNYIVRTSTPAAFLVPALQRALRTLDPELVFLDRGTLRGLADVRLFAVRAGAWLIGAFGALALLVASVGLYGVIGYSVSRRVREIGIRRALGARSSQLVGMVLGEGMVLVAIGGAVGALLAALVSQLLSSVLFVNPLDLVSFATAFMVLAAIALIANAVPARRAARIDPMVAFRDG